MCIYINIISDYYKYLSNIYMSHLKSLSYIKITLDLWHCTVITPNENIILCA